MKYLFDRYISESDLSYYHKRIYDFVKEIMPNAQLVQAFNGNFAFQVLNLLRLN
jgi:hypothetical protein